VRVAAVLLVLAAALALQTSVAAWLVGRLTVDLVLVAVVFIALTFGPVAGLLGGAVGGIAQDALAGGVLGIGGLAKTLVGFAAGSIGAQFIVSSAVPRFVMFFAATVVHVACILGVHALLPDARPAEVSYGQIALQATANGVIGLLTFQAVEGLPGLLQRRRIRRSYSRRRV
jgi:rod shape-determining protein MreD